jgi:hypothetical protein
MWVGEVNPVSPSSSASLPPVLRPDSAPFEAPPEPAPEVSGEGLDVAALETADPAPITPGGVGPTLLLDWDRERFPGPVPRRVPLPVDSAVPSWLAFPHQRYVLSVRQKSGSVESVYVTSLVGRRDSLIPGGTVERIVTDDRSVTVVVNGRPYLYAVEAGTTIDLVGRRVLGASA